MLLSEQERNQLEDDLEQPIGKNAFDAIEAVILAKLASADLPEPKEFAAWGYDAAQLHEAHAQGFAAGAAAQLAEMPKCWAIFTEDGNARMWSTFQPHVQKLADAEGLAVTELYTRREA